MSARIKPNPSKDSRSLVTALATAFVFLSIIPLLLVSSLLGYFNFQTQRESLFNRQQLIAIEAAREVSGFIEQIFRALEASAQVGQTSDQEQQRLILEKLLGLEDALREVILVDKAGQKITGASRRSLISSSSNLSKWAESNLLAQVGQDQRFISPVYFDEATAEPLVSMVVPVKDVFGEFQGALLAEVNLKFMWDVVDKLQSTAYVVDKQGKLIAFKDTLRVLKGENLSQLTEVAEFISGPDEEEFEYYSIGINRLPVVATYVPLGTPDWAVVIEVPVEEAYQSSIYSAYLLLGTFLVIAILAVGVGVYASRYLTRPLLNLTQAATRLAAGEIGLQAPMEGPTEVVGLASAFNHMTAQLQELIGSLEEQVAARTRRLEIAATLSERVSAILHPEQLLIEVVNQIKQSFNYYHAHIYLLDDKKEKLVVAEGAGEAGAEMKARGHSILLNAPTSLVARAARTGEIVRVDNVREAVDWLPNPLLPGTHSEIAVPIILDKHVVGVLDVQSEQVAGLDEGDAGLLRSLANQIAVAIRNARLFEQVEHALAEARTAQKQYLQEVWQKSKLTQSQYLYIRPGAAPLDETGRQNMVQAQQQVLEQDRPAVIITNSDDSHQKSLIAPINLLDNTIGTTQLYLGADDQPWTEDDLVLVKAVIDQFAQTAENLRLFDETREQASFEQVVGEITQKLRQASSMKLLVKMAAEELSRALGTSHSMVKIGTLSQSQPAKDQPAQGRRNGKPE